MTGITEENVQGQGKGKVSIGKNWLSPEFNFISHKNIVP
jgi:hypothetical protein